MSKLSDASTLPAKTCFAQQFRHPLSMATDVMHVEARYRTLAEATAQVTFVSAPDGSVIEVSGTWTAFTGHPKAAALGRGFLDLVPPEDRAGFAERWAVALREGRTFEAEFRLRHAAGHYLYVRSRSLPLHEEGRVRELLDSAGYTVIEAGDAEEAFRLFESRGAPAIDMLVTDVVLPGLNGLRLAERLKAIVPGLKTLYVSGYSGTTAIRQDSFDPGTAFLAKPFSRQMLTEKVREMLDAG
jgi:PAS domain S-box-containing protein